MDINCCDCRAWFNRGKILASFGKYEEALACYNNALSLDISYYEAWCEKGVILEELGYWEEAEDCFNESLGIFTGEDLDENSLGEETFSIPGEDRGSFDYNQACFHALAGNLDLAFTYLNNALNFNPNKYLKMITYDRDLDGLRPDPRLKELLQNQENLAIVESIRC